MKITSPYGLKYSPDTWPCIPTSFLHIWNSVQFFFTVLRNAKKCTFFCPLRYTIAWQPLVQLTKMIFLCHSPFLEPNIMAILTLGSFNLFLQSLGLRVQCFG
jgi:hypothetical protein